MIGISIGNGSGDAQAASAGWNRHDSGVYSDSSNRSVAQVEKLANVKLTTDRRPRDDGWQFRGIGGADHGVVSPSAITAS